MKTVIELGSGPQWQRWINDKSFRRNRDVIDANAFDVVICVDSIFNDVEDHEPYPHIVLSSLDVVKFLETYSNELADKIIANRILEHFDYKQVPYILYLMSNIIKKGGQLEIVVPDHIKVLEELKDLDHEKQTPLSFNRKMIDVHTELFNETHDPHQSVWSPSLAQYYLELEGYWDSIEVDNVTVDNRDWYLKITATRK